MKDSERSTLENIVLAPYIQKATALIGRRRRVGGNQFRHAMATLAILIDYHYTDPVLLKASVIHDLFEDLPDTDRGEVAAIDGDGRAVVALVLEVTRSRNEPKAAYLQRLLTAGSERARTLKVADRISNLTDLHETVFSADFVGRYLAETERFVLPMAEGISEDLTREIRYLTARRRAESSALSAPGVADLEPVGV